VRKLIVLVMALALMTSPSWALHLIDDFTESNAGDTADVVLSENVLNNEESAYISGLNTANCVGGIRALYVKTTLAPVSGSNMLTVSQAGDLVAMDNPSASNSIMALGYGTLTDEATNGLESEDGDLNLDFTGDVGLNFDLVDADLSTTVTVQMDTAGGGIYTTNPIAVGIAAGTKQIFWTDFTSDPSADLGDVEGLAFTFTGPNAWDIQIDRIGSSEYQIPEPATMSLVGLGLVALVRRRRRK